MCVMFIVSDILYNTEHYNTEHNHSQYIIINIVSHNTHIHIQYNTQQKYKQNEDATSITRIYSLTYSASENCELQYQQR